MSLTRASAAVIKTEEIVNNRNRIINGDMRIDQRNAGAAVTTSGSFAVDRFTTINTTDGAFSAQQDSTAPPDFNKSLKLTITTADSSLTTTQLLCHIQRIEGFNTADLNWGTANAKTITLSFWVRSSVTGTFGGSLRNATPNRAYAFSYTINAADTWEYKTVTIVGDTTGTWATDNSSGIQVGFCLGGGPSRLTTAGSWGSDGNILGPTGQTNLTATLNATWYITGVQLEVGSVATPFERRPYGTELSLCQRYFEKSFALSTKPENGVNNTSFTAPSEIFSGIAGPNQIQGSLVKFTVQKRAAPTFTFFGNSDGHWGYVEISNSNTLIFNQLATVLASVTVDRAILAQGVINNVVVAIRGHWTASSEL